MNLLVCRLLPAAASSSVFAMGDFLDFKKYKSNKLQHEASTTVVARRDAGRLATSQVARDTCSAGIGASVYRYVVETTTVCRCTVYCMWLALITMQSKWEYSEKQNVPYGTFATVLNVESTIPSCPQPPKP